VAVGVAFAAELARNLDRIGDARVEHHRVVIEKSYGLDTRPPEGMSVEALMRTMSRDKKAVNGMTFILDSVRGLEVVENVDEGTVRRTLEDFLAD
jgi:3-dehydroquinate synthetase